MSKRLTVTYKQGKNNFYSCLLPVRAVLITCLFKSVFKSFSVVFLESLMAISFLCLRLAYENKINTNKILLDAEDAHAVNPC